MNTPEKLNQSDFIRILQRLHAAQLSAGNDEAAREAADADLGHFLRMSNAGRLQEWIAQHPSKLHRYRHL